MVCGANFAARARDFVYSTAQTSMFGFLGNRRSETQGNAEVSLGRLELRVMEIIWSLGEGCVREVGEQLERPLAYTTVMTTLDRLYKKGLLERRKLDRAFLYSARISRPEWERRRAAEVLRHFLGQSGASRERLVSCLLDAVGQHDAALLEELEKKIRAKRRELRRGQP